MSNTMPMPLLLTPIATEVSMGNDSLEAPKRPRSKAPIIAFEKARANIAENLSKRTENNDEKRLQKGNSLWGNTPSGSLRSS